jgi:DNA-binding CsgD family transcriptional regulator
MAVVLNSLKGHSISENNSILAIEYNWDRLLGEIESVLSQLGFSYFSYSVATCKHLQAEFDLDRMLHSTRSREVAGSMPDKVVREYLENISDQDPVVDLLSSHRGPLVVNGSSVSSCSVVDAFWEKNGVASRVYIPLESRSSEYWFHYFTLYHGLADDEFNQMFAKVEQWLVPALNRYHKMLQTVCEKQQNPFLQHEILSSTCLQILKMTSQGMPVKRIADKLKLTEEGITYHITRAKRIFGAKNKTHLIAILYDIGLM